MGNTHTHTVSYTECKLYYAVTQEKIEDDALYLGEESLKGPRYL